ncbi:type II toxin-antitoxin system RatA family toxin [Beggiatoa leptomitoformis]|uniref:Type II toxin-antitoxin system RatA family toxin n=1 Tax=Beggiatoa leptomitoformis TaxID=288004 RepID=A0A2N9YAI8_9GAMM|nr:type II toxin-antitoxin system RatA family toxin [Beggiatoa leptomitoformis]ALG67131.1 type II toxin-antitoxin system RatA family toxin [Beggiatoa leptomitoformis]AUI67470.1 type II toxin-antitoxin system RatA family toxin [Beggiatoa leptomitoformis]
MTTHIHKTALVPYLVHDMYALVSRIEDYPDFLPWCKSTRVLSTQGTEVNASITMGRIGLDKSFTTRNVLIPNTSIEMHLMEGPFSHLYGKWLFEPLGNEGCKITLDMQFEISNPLLRISLKPIFTKIVDTLMDSFIQQAYERFNTV